MKIRTLTMVWATLLFVSCNTKFKGQNKIEQIGAVSLVKNETGKKVDVMIDGYFTSYWWPDTVMKPVLYPVYTSSGTEVTRGFPIKPRAGCYYDWQYNNWQPKARDFVTDLINAKAGGAEGWCFHNGSRREQADEKLRGSFEMSEKRLFDELDKEELEAIETIDKMLKK